MDLGGQADWVPFTEQGSGRKCVLVREGWLKVCSFPARCEWKLFSHFMGGPCSGLNSGPKRCVHPECVNVNLFKNEFWQM